MMDGGVTAMGTAMGGDDGNAGTVVLNANGGVFTWRQLDGCFGD